MKIAVAVVDLPYSSFPDIPYLILLFSISGTGQLGDTLTYLGELYILIGKLEKSEGYLRKALRLTEDIHDSNQHAIVLGYLGEINYLKHNYKNAKDCFEKSLSATHVKGVNVGGKVWCNIGLALIQEKLGNKKEAYSLLHIAQENIVNLGIWYDQLRPLMIEYKRLSSSIFHNTTAS